MAIDLFPPTDMLLFQDTLEGLSAHVNPAAPNLGLRFDSELGEGKGLYPASSQLRYISKIRLFLFHEVT